jgi:hypothetical protein
MLNNEFFKINVADTTGLQLLQEEFKNKVLKI